MENTTGFGTQKQGQNTKIPEFGQNQGGCRPRNHQPNPRGFPKKWRKNRFWDPQKGQTAKKTPESGQHLGGLPPQEITSTTPEAFHTKWGEEQVLGTNAQELEQSQGGHHRGMPKCLHGMVVWAKAHAHRGPWKHPRDMPKCKPGLVIWAKTHVHRGALGARHCWAWLSIQDLHGTPNMCLSLKRIECPMPALIWVD